MSCKIITGNIEYSLHFGSSGDDTTAAPLPPTTHAYSAVRLHIPFQLKQSIPIGEVANLNDKSRLLIQRYNLLSHRSRREIFSIVLACITVLHSLISHVLSKQPPFDCSLDSSSLEHCRYASDRNSRLGIVVFTPPTYSHECPAPSS